MITKKHLKNEYFNIYNKTFKLFNGKKTIFFVGMWMGILNLFISILTDGSDVINNLLFCQDYLTFTDYFECIVYGRGPYIHNGSYPPLAYLFFALFGKLVPKEIRESGFFAVRDSQMGLFSLGVFLVVSFILLYSFIEQYYIGTNIEKLFFIITLIASIPMIFLIERANIVFIIMPLCGYYLFNYDSTNKYKRYMSYICLSIAVGIKIYPVVLGLLLVRRKNTKEIILCILCGILVFFLPFLFFGGADGFIGFWNNLINSLNIIGDELGYGYKINISNTFGWIGSVLSIPQFMSTTSNVVWCLMGLSGGYAIIFGKYEQRWKLWTIPLLLMLLLPNFSFIYSLIFLFIPLIDFLNEKQNKADNLYAILFILLFVPFVLSKKSFFEVLSNDYYLLNFSTVVESITAVILYFVLVIEGILNSYCTVKNIWQNHKK